MRIFLELNHCWLLADAEPLWAGYQHDAVAHVEAQHYGRCTRQYHTGQPLPNLQPLPPPIFLRTTDCRSILCTHHEAHCNDWGSQVGLATGSSAEAARLVDHCRYRLRAIAGAVAKEYRPRILTLESIEPLVLGQYPASQDPSHSSCVPLMSGAA